MNKEKEKEKIAEINENNIYYIINEDIKPNNNNKNNKCCVCSSHNEEITFVFSCTHNTCLMCLFKYFISNNFKGLEYEYVTLNCPLCKYGSAKFSAEVWLSLLNKINSKNNNMQSAQDINKNCNIHKKNAIVKYCNQCQKYLCEICLKNYHKNLVGHTLIDKNSGGDLPFPGPDMKMNFNAKAYKEFEDDFKKKENIFFDKIENEYILKKTKIEELIRRLTQLLNEYTTQMNIFQKNIQTIFRIINFSYYIYFTTFNTFNNENELLNNMNLNLYNKIIDIKFISTNTFDITEISTLFYKKMQEINTKLSTSTGTGSPDKIFDYEFIWSNTGPKVKFVLKDEDREKQDSILKLLELKHTKVLATGQMKGNLNIWDINEKEIILRLTGHRSAVWALIENSDGYLISGSSDKTIKVWDVANRKENCLITLKGHKGTVFCLAELEKNKIISGSDDATLRVWNIFDKKQPCILTMIDPNKSKINCLITFKISNFVLTGNDDNLIKIWNINPDTGFVTNFLEGHSCTVWCMSTLSDEEILASGSSDNMIKIWDMINLKLLFTLKGHENTISSITALRNKLLASSSWDNTCKIWNLNSRNCIYTLEGHKDIVWCLIQLENGDIASSSNDKSIIIWEK